VTSSWLLLAFAVWVGLWTLVSFKPPFRPPVLMAVGFFAAWSTTELAPWHLVWQIAVVVVLIVFGALHSWPGWVALPILAAAWIGLAASVKGAVQTDREFTDALRADLGPNWDAALDPALERAGRHVNWARVALPFWFRRRGVQRVANIQYVEGDALRRHRLDVYRHKDVRAGAPVLMQIHGGGWIISNKHQQGQPLMHHVAARGWVCVAINYRLSPRATWPDQLVDCKRALAWIREHIAEYGGDPNFVVVTGGSAGGHLTTMMGLTANDPKWQPGFETADTAVDGMIPLYGVYDWTGTVTTRGDSGLRDILERYIVKHTRGEAPELFRDASPMFHVRPDAPPALIVHGDLDTLAPVEMARTFVEKLRAVSREPVIYVELKGAHHAFEVFNSVRTMHAIAGIDLFLAWLISAARASASSSPGAGVPSRNDAGASAVTGRRPTAYTEP